MRRAAIAARARANSRRFFAAARGPTLALPRFMRVTWIRLALAIAFGSSCGGGDGGGGPGPIGATPSPLRRLSHVEYANTVRDLFAGVDVPVPSFAADPTVFGFENNADVQAVSPLLVEQYRTASLDIAAAAAARLDLVSPCTSDDAACGAELVRAFGARAFRRPLDDGELARFGAFFEEQRAAHGFTIAARLTIQAMLQSPQFLYRPELGGPPDGARTPLQPYELASRLSYFFWQSMPDDELFAAAASNALATDEEIEAQARRLAADPRARAMVIDFHRQWLDLARLEQTSKDPATYPAWDDALRAAMREETERFLSHVIFDGEGSLDALLTSSETFVDADLAELYGVAPPQDWTLVTLDARERAGLLTQASFLAGHAHTVHPSPVQRGVFVLDRLFCSPLPPPAPGVDTTPPQPEPGEATTNRDRYEAHEINECASCHEIIDGIGFALEHYDAIGRYRTLDNGLPVDSMTHLVGTDVDRPVADGVDLAATLAESDSVRRCYVTQWFRFAFGRGAIVADAPTIDALDRSFIDSGEHVIELLVAIARSDEFRTRSVP